MGFVRSRGFRGVMCLSAVALVAWIWLSRETARPQITRADVQEERIDRHDRSETRANVEAAAISAMFKKTADLERRLAELEAKRPVKEPKGSDTEREAAIAASAAIDAIPLDRKIESIDRSFVKEVADPAWAPGAEAKIRRTFGEKGLQGTVLEQSECRATFCRVSARHESRKNQEEFDSFVDRIPMGAYAIPTRAQDGTYRSVVFFVRREYESPDHPVRRRGMP